MVDGRAHDDIARPVYKNVMYAYIFHVTRKLPTYIELAQLKFTIHLVKYLFMIYLTEKHFMIQLHLFIASNQHLSHQFLVYATLWNGTEPTQNIRKMLKRGMIISRTTTCTMADLWRGQGAVQPPPSLILVNCSLPYSEILALLGLASPYKTTSAIKPSLFTDNLTERN